LKLFFMITIITLERINKMGGIQWMHPPTQDSQFILFPIDVLTLVCIIIGLFTHHYSVQFKINNMNKFTKTYSVKAKKLKHFLSKQALRNICTDLQKELIIAVCCVDIEYNNCNRLTWKFLLLLWSRFVNTPYLFFFKNVKE
jgi:abortive infection bacteriophage resistance protein